MYWENFVDDPELSAWLHQMYDDVLGLWEGLGLPSDTSDVHECIRDDLDVMYGAIFVDWGNAWLYSDLGVDPQLHVRFALRMYPVVSMVLRDHGFVAAIEDPMELGELMVVVRDRVGECVPVGLRRRVGRAGAGVGVSRGVSGEVARVVEVLGWVPLPVADRDGPGVVVGVADGRVVVCWRSGRDCRSIESHVVECMCEVCWLDRAVVETMNAAVRDVLGIAGFDTALIDDAGSEVFGWVAVNGTMETG